MLDRTWLLATSRAEREALGRTIQYSPPEIWDEESVSVGWRNRDIIAHLAASDVAAAAVIGGEAPAEIEEYAKTLTGGDRFTVDDYNQWTVDRRAGESFRAIVLEWGRAADLLLARAGRIPPDEWRERSVPWVTGEIRVGYLLQSRVMEWWLHGEDIGTAAELPPRIEHPPLHCVNDLAIRTIPHALQLADLSYPGTSVKIELQGAGGGTWHQGLATREFPEPDKEPNAVIEGRAYSFALVAGRRIPAEYYLAEGVLLVGGDVE